MSFADHFGLMVLSWRQVVNHGDGGITPYHVGYDICSVQELPGPSDVSTTMTYTLILNKGGKGVTSPLDQLTRQGAIRRVQ